MVHSEVGAGHTRRRPESYELARPSAAGDVDFDQGQFQEMTEREKQKITCLSDSTEWLNCIIYCISRQIIMLIDAEITYISVQYISNIGRLTFDLSQLLELGPCTKPNNSLMREFLNAKLAPVHLTSFGLCSSCSTLKPRPLTQPLLCHKSLSDVIDTLSPPVLTKSACE